MNPNGHENIFIGMFGLNETKEEKLVKQLKTEKEKNKHLNTVLDRAKALATAITAALQNNDRETALQLTYLLSDIVA